MALLLLFALIAGAGTALSPCVLPILPALLSAGATGGRRRPLGIVLGLAVTFTITIVGLAEVVDGVGLGDGSLRTVAVIVLLGFGVLLLVPRLADRRRGVAVAADPRSARRTGGDGFVSGLGVGAALGFVYAPCAGPILAAVISVSAASGRTVAVAIAYAVGSAAALLVALPSAAGAVLEPGRAGRGLLQRVMGVVMILTALAVATDRDVRFQTAIADDLPGFLVNPTGTSSARARSPSGSTTCAARPSSPPPAATGLPELGAGARLRRRHALAELQAADAAGTARQGRADRLLDLHLHQLPAHAALPARLGRALPRPRAGDRRRPHARVRLREGHRATSATRSPATTCATRSRRTTTTAPGTPGATSTGPPST